VSRSKKRAYAPIRDNCTNLAALETSLQTTTAMEFAIDALDSPRAAAGCGWTIEITEREESEESVGSFDGYDDYLDYDYYEEMRREREEEEWEEEHYRRRRDPYWKNDSDYD
jgi:hypothetical protein